MNRTATDTWVAPGLSSGLGNRLFQFAAAAGAAERWRTPLVFSLPCCKEAPHGAFATIFRMYPHIPQVEEGFTAEVKEIPQTHYEFAELPVTAPASKTLLHGFRQNPRYFPKDSSALEPNWDFALGGSAVRRWIEFDAGFTNPQERARTVSLHVRLGDYRKLAHHQENLTSYYARALQKVGPGSRLHLFSDEPDLCRAQFGQLCAARGLNLTVAKVRSDVESLYEMSLCLGGNITANSTFSWWGAWFAHAAGSPWATYPSRWGQGMPDPAGVVPAWGEVISVGNASFP